MPRIETPWGPWEAAPLDAVVALFQNLAAPWWVSGGYAIELAVGRSFREHADVDINVLRRDQLAVRALLADWDVYAADPPGELRPWPVDEPLPPHVHDIWVREHPGGPWRFQLMLEEADGDEWVYRRDARIRCPLASVGISAQGFLRLTPEIQLLFKARGTRPKDELDFEQVLPHLTREQADWLREALATEHGRHPWQERLGS
ncbi:amino acid transporter [Microtetraspora sp. NBRC 16547]|uniref:nucleotidyltransferase domain-containing protein n=1 Tax=Microtetraspora sp. NBRC 16547 TaxID=3030993 RepID=UPI0024A60062|nr:amino acid transporter [Microtetraspora sp. NBRC 16547]GLW99081.1 hypothetical protein Misp02_31680 [Microtetraspora sp. NBRC 16547]